VQHCRDRERGSGTADLEQAAARTEGETRRHVASQTRDPRHGAGVGCLDCDAGQPIAGIIARRAPAPRRMQQCEEDCAIGSVARLRLPSTALLCHRPGRPSRHAARPVAVPNGAPSNPAAADPALARAASRGHAYGFRASLRGPKAECVRNRTFLTASAKVKKWRFLSVQIDDSNASFPPRPDLAEPHQAILSRNAPTDHVRHLLPSMSLLQICRSHYD
jgi:hypothetical protein